MIIVKLYFKTSCSKENLCSTEKHINPSADESGKAKRKWFSLRELLWLSLNLRGIRQMLWSANYFTNATNILWHKPVLSSDCCTMAKRTISVFSRTRINFHKQLKRGKTFPQHNFAVIFCTWLRALHNTREIIISLYCYNSKIYDELFFLSLALALHSALNWHWRMRWDALRGTSHEWAKRKESREEKIIFSYLAIKLMSRRIMGTINQRLGNLIFLLRGHLRNNLTHHHELELQTSLTFLKR